MGKSPLTGVMDKVAWCNEDLLVTRVEYLAMIKPNAVYAEYPNAALNYDSGFRQITYAQLANAVNGIAWWLQQTIGRGKTFEALSYVGPNDLRYPALILGAVKAGYMTFLTSPRNSVAAHLRLFDQLNCKTIISPEPRPLATKAILKARKLRVLNIPTVESLLEVQYGHFPYSKNFASSHSDPLVALHTSGSTGFPKAFIYTHQVAATIIRQNSLVPPAGFASQDMSYQGKRVFFMFPPFHAASVICQLFISIPHETVLIAPLSGAIPSSESLIEGLKMTSADVVMATPSILQEVAENRSHLNFLAQNVDAVIYSGGHLPQSIGDVIAAKIHLLPFYGSSEMGLVALIKSDTDHRCADWAYVRFHPDIGARFRHIADDMYELQATYDQRFSEQQPVFSLLPDLKEYSTRDIFVRHPSMDRKDLWKWHARADDIIVFLNGEKTNPISMEQDIVSRSPNVAAALVVGAQRVQAVLLIEPAEGTRDLSPREQTNLIERIWPTVEATNRDCPAHAQIMKSHILFTTPQKPMIRTWKGFIQRTATMDLYSEELNALSDDPNNAITTSRGTSAMSTHILRDREALSMFIITSILSVTGWKTIEEADNFFLLGMDSLQAMMVIRVLNHHLMLPNLALRIIYGNPSISTLAAATMQLSSSEPNVCISAHPKEIEEMDLLLQHYQQDIKRFSLVAQNNNTCRTEIFILTGSTGALGSYILDTLLRQPEVRHIYCLNRSLDSEDLQLRRNGARGLSTSWDPSRVSFLTVDLSQRFFGLPSAKYSELLLHVTTVIHNAWPVDFNLSIASFQPQLRGVVNIVDFATSAAKQVHVFFISSISSVMNHCSQSGQIPEDIISDPAAPASNGYGQSKYLSECLLDYAAKTLGIYASVARVGQISGSARGRGSWNRAEWFPSLVLSSIHMGKIPATLGPRLNIIEWVPVDLLADIIVELAIISEGLVENEWQDHNKDDKVTAKRRVRVLHPLNPQTTSWEAVQPIVINEISSCMNGQSDPIKIVSSKDWLEQLNKDTASTVSLRDAEFQGFLHDHPAVKLLDFYQTELSISAENINRFEIQDTRQRCRSMQLLRGLREEWIRKWIRELALTCG